MTACTIARLLLMLTVTKCQLKPNPRGPRSCCGARGGTDSDSLGVGWTFRALEHAQKEMTDP